MSFKEAILPMLAQRKKLLEATIKKAGKAVNYDMQEHLLVVLNKNHFRYYTKASCVKGQAMPKRKYLNNSETAKKIAQNDYSKQVIKRATQELKAIDNLLKEYQKSTPEECYLYLHPGRKVLVDTYLYDDEGFAEEWMKNAEKNRKQINSYPIQFPIQTEKMEIVRSKSEKIIADKLYMSGVPYIYEKPLMLGKTIKYPDFTTLNKRTHKEFYWEHLGLVDNPDYFNDAMMKLRQYSENGIWPGKNLIITYETTNQPLDMEMIDRIIQEYLM